MPIRVAIRYAGRWSAIIFFVVLLTLIFSFLGTIICAVLAGMMMGATKHPRWQAMAIAVVFPAVIFTLLRGSRAELLERQIIELALLCFGAFWATYLVTGFVIWFERKQAAIVTPASEPAAETGLVHTGASHEPTLEPLCIEALQGEWVCQPVPSDPPAQQKKLAIEGDKVTLSLIEDNGQTRPVAEGKVRLG